MTANQPSFKSQLSTSSALLSVRFASNMGLRIVSTLVLSRLLAPEIYGVFAIVLVYMYILEMLSDFGVRPLILTREGDVADSFLHTCWCVSILRGLVILVISGLLGLFFAFAQGQSWFAEDSAYAAGVLPYAIAALGFTAFVRGFSSPNKFMYQRRMEFGRVIIVDLIRNLITLAATIGLAIYLRSVWALVYGQLVRAVIDVGLSFAVFHGTKMRLRMDWDSLRIVIDRGKWVVGQSALTVVSQAFDRILLGFVMNSATFGYYYIARQLVDIVPQFLLGLNSAVILQVFRRLNESTLEEFRRNYYRYRLVVDAAAGVVTGGIVVLAPLFVDIVFDDRYADVAYMMQVLSLGTLLIGAMVLRSAYNAKQRFDVPTKLSVISVVSMVGGLLVAAFVADSVELALLVVALHRLPEALVILYLGVRQGWVVLWREATVLMVFGAAALASAGLLLILRQVFPLI